MNENSPYTVDRLTFLPRIDLSGVGHNDIELSEALQGAVHGGLDGLSVDDIGDKGGNLCFRYLGNDACFRITLGPDQSAVSVCTLTRTSIKRERIQTIVESVG